MPELRVPARVGAVGGETPTLLQHPAGSIPAPWVPGAQCASTRIFPWGLCTHPGVTGWVPEPCRASAKKIPTLAGVASVFSPLPCRGRWMKGGRKWEDLGVLAQNEPLGHRGRSLRGGRERLRRVRRAGGKLRHGARHATWLSPTQKPRGAHRLHPASRCARAFAPFGGSFCLFDVSRHAELEPG